MCSIVSSSSNVKQTIDKEREGSGHSTCSWVHVPEKLSSAFLAMVCLQQPPCQTQRVNMRQAQTATHIPMQCDDNSLNVQVIHPGPYCIINYRNVCGKVTKRDFSMNIRQKAYLARTARIAVQGRPRPSQSQSPKLQTSHHGLRLML